MLQLQNISLYQFKNYISSQFAFTKKVVGICGLNGAGKTNILDAIYYLSFTKSYFTKTDTQNVHNGLQGFRINGQFLLGNDEQEIVAILRENNRKEFSINGVDYKKMSEHIGIMPCVMIAPDDIELITGGSEERRKLIDTILSQINAAYLQTLIEYNKILQQRNSFIKNAVDNGYTNQELLDIYNSQLAEKGTVIYNYRTVFLAEFLPLVNEFYTIIAGKTDAISLAFNSDLQKGDLLVLLKNAQQKDFILQRTTVGTHKDDIAITIGNVLFKNSASQGQRKSLLFAIKLAEWQILKNKKGFAPILLLDDVFEKLDEQRMHNLLQWVCKENDGQIFITDTHKERLQLQLRQLGISFQLIVL